MKLNRKPVTVPIYAKRKTRIDDGDYDDDDDNDDDDDDDDEDDHDDDDDDEEEEEEEEDNNSLHLHVNTDNTTLKPLANVTLTKNRVSLKQRPLKNEDPKASKTLKQRPPNFPREFYP